MKPTLILLVLALAACGRSEEPTSPAAMSPTEKAAPGLAEKPKSPSVPPVAQAPTATKEVGLVGADTSASEAYHTKDLAGRAGFPPGSGALVEVPERDKRAMLAAAMTFFDAARTENRDAMRDVSTQLFTTNLIDNLDRYRERFYMGLKESLAASLKGADAGEVRMPDEGHFEIELKFADGTNRRLMMAVETGHWRVNRL